jgi:hypothetical protein
MRGATAMLILLILIFTRLSVAELYRIVCFLLRFTRRCKYCIECDCEREVLATEFRFGVCAARFLTGHEFLFFL